MCLRSRDVRTNAGHRRRYIRFRPAILERSGAKIKSGEILLRVRALADRGDVARHLGVPHNTMSTHLGILVRAGLAASRRDGRSIIYAADYDGIRALITSNSSLLAAKVAERSAETGEHYITRDWPQYRSMLRKAAGGGALTGGTTLLKFMIMGLGLSAFWGGFWAGAMYAASFVVIQLLHCTLATKQPAMTAPAMAAKLKDIGTPEAVNAFVDEVAHLMRSQAAAVLGNVLVVFPAVLALTLGWAHFKGTPFIDAIYAQQTLHSLSLLGPSVLYAALTGVLLFSSSIIAGWTENWFVLHRMDSAIRYNPNITRVLGKPRAARWARPSCCCFWGVR